jgi:hypothetical protein
LIALERSMLNFVVLSYHAIHFYQQLIAGVVLAGISATYIKRQRYIDILAKLVDVLVRSCKH